MFDFIVSGQIPGTQIEVTFQTVIAATGLVLGVGIARKITKTQRSENRLGVEEVTL